MSVDVLEAETGLEPGSDNYLDIGQKYFGTPGVKYEKYIQMMYSVFPDYQEAIELAEDCGYSGSVWRCDNGHGVFFPSRCQKRRVCPVCSSKTSKRNSDVVMGVFERISQYMPRLSIVHMVFTLPMELWDRIHYDNIDDVLGAVYETISKMYPGVRTGGHVNVHMGSVDRLDRCNPHIDVLMPNVVWNKHKYIQVEFDTERGECVEVEHGGFQYITAFQDVDRLRELWKDELERVFKRDFEAVDLFCSYVKWDGESDESMGRIGHRVKYHSRSFQHELAEKIDMFEGDIVGVAGKRYNLKDVKATIETLLDPPGNWHRNRWFGWLSNSVRARYMKNFYVSDAELVEEMKKQGCKCPICGEKLYDQCDEYGNYFTLIEKGFKIEHGRLIDRG